MKDIEIKKAVAAFLRYIKLGWDTEESFEIAYDSVFDIIEKESFLDRCQAATVEMKQSISN